MNSMSPTTPGTAGQQTFAFGHSPTSARSQTGFKRPASSDDDEQTGERNGRAHHARRQAAVKRACNECRQQKLRCDVQQDPFVSCARCVKHKLECVIEPNFKRVGKRSRNLEMEKKLREMEDELAMFRSGRVPVPPQQPHPHPHQHQHQQQNMLTPHPSSENHAYNNGPAHADDDDSYLQTQHQQVAATSLLDLRSGSPMFFTLGDVRLSALQAQELFAEYFQYYHDYLPFLDALRTPDDIYAKDSTLLFWAIISVAARHYESDPQLLKRLKEPLTNLIWQAVRSQPTHHIVKALCLLCTWPLPASRTSTDPTFMLCGIMMQIAMHIGLHQPTSPQDFSRTKVRIRKEDIEDRLRTWAVCNIVAQTVSTGYGQPSIMLYESILDFKMDDTNPLSTIPPTLFVRLRQEIAASRISKKYSTMSSRKSDGTFSDAQAFYFIKLEADRLNEEKGSSDGVDEELENLHHCAALLHLHLFAFFNNEPVIQKRTDLLELYFAAYAFLDRCFKLQADKKLKYAPYYIMQMVLAAGFALLKLLNSEFAEKLPFEQGRLCVLQTVDALRKSKVVVNDLLDRLAEVLAQLWKANSSGRSLHSMSQSPVVGNTAMANMFNNRPAMQQPQQTSRKGSLGILDHPLRLFMRSRMSMSVVYDSIWRWRESQVDGSGEQLDSTVVNNPTNPDSSSSSTPPPGQAVENPAHSLPNFDPRYGTLSMPLQLPNGLASANSFEIFDPVSWMLDAQTEWNPQQYGSNTFSHDFGV